MLLSPDKVYKRVGTYFSILGSDHLPLRKKMSSSGPAQTHLLAAAGNSASQMNSSGIGHMASGAGFSGVALGNSGGGGVQQQNTFSQGRTLKIK